MPASEKASWAVAGAAVAVVGVLLTLFALVDKLDERYTTRREYAATLSSISGQLGEIKAELRDMKHQKERP